MPFWSIRCWVSCRRNLTVRFLFHRFQDRARQRPASRRHRVVPAWNWGDGHQSYRHPSARLAGDRGARAGWRPSPTSRLRGARRGGGLVAHGAAPRGEIRQRRSRRLPSRRTAARNDHLSRLAQQATSPFSARESSSRAMPTPVTSRRQRQRPGVLRDRCAGPAPRQRAGGDDAEVRASLRALPLIITKANVSRVHRHARGLRRHQDLPQRRRASVEIVSSACSPQAT
jgi:hypothetical protein